VCACYFINFSGLFHILPNLIDSAPLLLPLHQVLGDPALAFGAVRASHWAVGPDVFACLPGSMGAGCLGGQILLGGIGRDPFPDRRAQPGCGQSDPAEQRASADQRPHLGNGRGGGLGRHGHVRGFL